MRPCCLLLLLLLAPAAAISPQPDTSPVPGLEGTPTAEVPGSIPIGSEGSVAPGQDGSRPPSRPWIWPSGSLQAVLEALRLLHRGSKAPCALRLRVTGPQRGWVSGKRGSGGDPTEGPVPIFEGLVSPTAPAGADFPRAGRLVPARGDAAGRLPELPHEGEDTKGTLGGRTSQGGVPVSPRGDPAASSHSPVATGGPGSGSVGPASGSAYGTAAAPGPGSGGATTTPEGPEEPPMLWGLHGPPTLLMSLLMSQLTSQ